jgi:hypothetical protein
MTKMTKTRKTFEFLVLVSFWFPAHAQTREACQSAVKHLTLPPTVEYPAMHPGIPLSPIEFLYSSRGIDAYAVVFNGVPNYYPVTGQSPNNVSLILVYQDEEVRQQMIGTLRDAHLAIRQSDATAPSLDNFKFATVHCVLGGKEFLSTGKCVANDIQYYKPQACIVVPQAKDFSDLSVLAASGAHNYRDALNGLNWLAGIDNIPHASKIKGEQPLSFDVSATVRTKLKEFASRH